MNFSFCAAIFGGRSGKREIAVFAFFVWIALTIKVFFVVPPELVKSYADLYIGVSWTIWVYIAGAFGVEHLSGSPKTQMSSSERRKEVKPPDKPGFPSGGS